MLVEGLVTLVQLAGLLHEDPGVEAELRALVRQVRAVACRRAPVSGSGQGA